MSSSQLASQRAATGGACSTSGTLISRPFYHRHAQGRVAASQRRGAAVNHLASSRHSRDDGHPTTNNSTAAFGSSSSSSSSSGWRAGSHSTVSHRGTFQKAAAAGGDVIDVDSAVVDEGAAALAKRPGTELAPRREGYHVVPLDTCEFLFAASADGALDMNDVYVYDRETDVYARPEVRGEMPKDASLYQIVPWREEYLGDELNHKEAQIWVKKAFLIRVAVGEGAAGGPSGYRLDLDTLLEVEDEGRTLARCEVERPPGAVRSDSEVLRIRNGRFTVVPDGAQPTPDEVIEAANEGRDAPNHLPGEEGYDGHTHGDGADSGVVDTEATAVAAGALPAGAATNSGYRDGSSSSGSGGGGGGSGGSGGGGSGSPTPMDSVSSADDGDVGEGEPDVDELADLEDDLSNYDIPPVDLA